ncbi:MAG: hypothetical protein RLZ60_1581 [Pseudomonadota bacterium]
MLVHSVCTDQRPDPKRGNNGHEIEDPVPVQVHQKRQAAIARIDRMHFFGSLAMRRLNLNNNWGEIMTSDAKLWAKHQIVQQAKQRQREDHR